MRSLVYKDFAEVLFFAICQSWLKTSFWVSAISWFSMMIPINSLPRERIAAAYSKLKHGENELRGEHFEATDIEFVKRILPPFFSRFYDQTTKYSNKILIEMAKNNGEITLSPLSEILRKEYNELSPHLGKLTQDGAVIRIDRGKYKLFHKLLAQYIKQTSGCC